MVTGWPEAAGRRDKSVEAPADQRRETGAQRDDRNMTELVQELRVAGLGVQVLFGFLLSLPFTVKFDRLSGFQHGLYLASVVLAATATILLIGPVAYHRLVFRRGLKEGLVRFANVLAVFGLAAVAGAVLAAVLLLTDYVAGAVAGALITAALACMIAVLWFAVPLTRRQERRLQRLLEAPFTPS
jgi:O-antigen/teichoic acid export membrane protein